MIKVLNHLYIFIFSFPLFLLHEPRVFTRGFCIVRSPDRQFVQGAVGIVPACHPEQAQRAEGSVLPLSLHIMRFALFVHGGYAPRLAFFSALTQKKLM